MSIYRDLREAIGRANTSLRHGFVPPVSLPQMQAILRIEATMTALDAIVAEEAQFRQGYIDAYAPWDAPQKFMGVTLYVVPYPLPAPGWRVVNPMVAK